MITLNNINLPDELWWDEFNYSPIKQEKTETPGGYVILQRGKMKEGRLIELTGTIRSNRILRNQLLELLTLFELDDPLDFNYRGKVYKVKVALDESDFFVCKPLRKDIDALSDNGVYYIETLKLIEVLP